MQTYGNMINLTNPLRLNSVPERSLESRTMKKTDILQEVLLISRSKAPRALSNTSKNIAKHRMETETNEGMREAMIRREVGEIPDDCSPGVEMPERAEEKVERERLLVEEQESLMEERCRKESRANRSQSRNHRNGRAVPGPQNGMPIHTNPGEPTSHQMSGQIKLQSKPIKSRAASITKSLLPPKTLSMTKGTAVTTALVRLQGDGEEGDEGAAPGAGATRLILVVATTANE